MNECEQDKEKLREFIIQSSENRKWIYSEQYGVGLSERPSYDRDSQRNDDAEIENEKIARHFAIDDAGKLIDFRVPGEFNAINHSYYCPYCGKEVFLKVDDNSNYAFAHLENGVFCDDEMYLRSAAVVAIHHAFLESSEFIIDVPQYHRCKQADKCPSNDDCKVPTTRQYDLKSHRYLKCEKDHKFNDVPYQTDLVFYIDDISKDSIEIRVNTENFDLELETPRRLIDVTVHSENDVCQLEKGLNGFDKVRFLNFNQDAKEKAEPREIQHEVLKYTIYASGKIHIGPKKCTELSCSLKRSNVIKEGVFIRTNGCLEDMYSFLLLRYKSIQNLLCRCQLCWFLKKSTGLSGDYICIRYKKVGTPKNPLREKNPPKECSYFRKNLNIKEGELNNEMEIVELG